MRRIVIAVALFPVLALGADLSPGTIQLTGGTGVAFSSGSRKTDDQEKVTTAERAFQLSGLYYLTKNLGVGLSAGYRFDSEEVVVEETTTAVAIGPAVGVHLPFAEKAAGFAILHVAYAYGQATTQEPGASRDEIETSGYAVEVIAGAKYFVTPSFSLDGSVDYELLQLRGEAPPGTRKPEIEISDLGLHVGVSVYF